jgi:hypothetical protein
MRRIKTMTLATAAALLAIWPFHHKTAPAPLPDAPTPATPTPATPLPDMQPFFDNIIAHCNVVSDDPITIMFLADDGTFQIGSDCFEAYRAWHALTPARPLPVA